MSPQTFFVALAAILVAMAWYANSSKRDKIYCVYRRANKTKRSKFVKMASRYVVFDGKRKDVIPSCITFEWWDKGIVHMLFPQWVATLDFSPSSRFPLDPNTLEPAIISDEVRNAMNKEEWVKSYAKGFTPPSSKRQSAIQQYIPWIAVILVLLVGVYLYTNLSALAHNQAIMQDQINSIAR